MGRRIILLSDGTGNSSAKVWRTNVWRVFERLDLSGSEQVAFYDDGVGTAAFKPLAILGGAFGFGLGRNVVDLYKFACRNYHGKDDAIYGFGFSRGAFTIRVVIGLILEQGIIQATSEKELHAKAKAAYSAYRKNNFHTNWWWIWQRLRHPLRARSGNIQSAPKIADPSSVQKNIKIRFLGLWDTVAAYGMPVEEMARGISQWLLPWMLPGCRLDSRVERACHALSIDDDRTTFHPVLWDEREEQPLVPADGKRLLARERISQVWFAGAHSNVGGGYPDDSLAQIPLVWILSEARECGLSFKVNADASPQTFGHPRTAQDKDGRAYEPRKGLGGYYRYGPRDIRTLGGDLLSRRGAPGYARIHESVFQRIKNRAHAYAPLGLPDEYEVVTASGEVFDSQRAGYESNPAARWNAQEKLWNVVWWRRLVYFLTIAVSAYLFAFPLIKAVPAQDEYTTRLRWLSDLVRVTGSFLPSAATPWLDGYAREPGKFLVVVLLLIAVLLWSSRLSGAIHSGIDQLWCASLASRLANSKLPKGFIYRFRTSPVVDGIHSLLKETIAPAIFAFLFFYVGVTFASHALFNVWDDFGFVCRGSASTVGLASGDFFYLDNGKPRTAALKPFADKASADKSNTTDPQANPRISNKNNPLFYLQKYKIALPEFEPDNPCQAMGVRLEQYGKYVITFDTAATGTGTFADGDGIKAPYGYYSFGVINARPPFSEHAQKISDPSPQSADVSVELSVRLRSALATTKSFISATWRSLPAMLSGAVGRDANPGMTRRQELRMMSLVPLRRELTRPWFRLVARTGSNGGEETFLDPDFTDPLIINVPITATREGELFLFVNEAVIGLPGAFNTFYKNNKGSVRVLIKRE